MTTCRGEHKTMTELHGKEAKEEDLKPFHQPHRLQSKSTQPARQTLRLWDLQKVTEAPTEENAPVLTAADLEARTHRSGTRLESELPPQQVQRSAQRWRAS